MASADSDKAYANEVRERIIEAARPYCTVIDELKDKGYTATVGFAPGPDGKYTLVQFELYKRIG